MPRAFAEREDERAFQNRGEASLAADEVAADEVAADEVAADEVAADKDTSPAGAFWLEQGRVTWSTTSGFTGWRWAVTGPKLQTGRA